MANRTLTKLVVFAFSLFCLSAASFAQSAPAIMPVADLVAKDMPYDSGGTVLLEWNAMPYDHNEGAQYKILVAAEENGPWLTADIIKADRYYASDIKLPFWAWTRSAGRHAYPVMLGKVYRADMPEQDPTVTLHAKDKYLLEQKEMKLTKEHADYLRSTKFFFKVVAMDGKKEAESGVVAATGKANWFNLPRINNLLYAIILFVIFLYFVSQAKKKDLFLRKIPGLAAVDDAIGRATEMGRPIYYLTGRQSISSMSTISATFILGEIAKKVAEYDSRIKVPHTDPITMTVCQEIVKQAYTEAGRPDSYRDDINFFLTEDQFAYTAAVDGMMTREKPAACFFMGYYYAEALLLSEIGSSVGAIQIAGTDAEHQLPFFFTTCDYTLMGEELYAAGAYLSRDPVLVGTLRAQDVGKAFVMCVVIIGILATTLGAINGWDAFVQVITDPFTSF